MAPSGLTDRIGKKAAAAIGKSGKEGLTAAEILALIGDVRHSNCKPVTEKTATLLLDNLAGQSRHVRKLEHGRYASLRPAKAAAASRHKSSRYDPVVEEHLAPVEEGWSWKHLVADGITSRKFWDGVMRYVAQVIESWRKDALSAAEILAALPEPVVRKSADFEPMDAAMLAEKLAFRSIKGEYVIDLKDGTFAAKP
ncbi:hypothetical protein [Methylobacterium sp. D54C]